MSEFTYQQVAGVLELMRVFRTQEPRASSPVELQGDVTNPDMGRLVFDAEKKQWLWDPSEAVS